MRLLSIHNMAAWLMGGFGVLAFAAFVSDQPVLWLAAFASGIGAAIYWVVNALAGHRHAQALQHFARDHGWDYRAHGGALTAGLTGYPFAAGESRRVEDVVAGTYAGLPCTSFTYAFDVATSKDGGKVPQLFTVTTAQLAVELPRLDLVPEWMGSRALGALGLTDIQVESAEFNRAWQVLSADRRFAIDVVEPRMMELLMRPDMQGWAVRIEGSQVLVWSAGRSGVGELSRRLDVVCGVARRIPAHVVRRYDEAERQRRAAQEARDNTGPSWATTPGVLNSRRYTGIGSEADGDGTDDLEQGTR